MGIGEGHATERRPGSTSGSSKAMTSYTSSGLCLRDLLDTPTRAGLSRGAIGGHPRAATAATGPSSWTSGRARVDMEETLWSRDDALQCISPDVKQHLATST